MFFFRLWTTQGNIIYLEIAEKTSSSETCALLDEVDIDSDEDVDSKMHDLDTEFFGKMK